MIELRFYDLKSKKSFMSKDYKMEADKRGRKRAVAMAPSGIKAYRYV